MFMGTNGAAGASEGTLDLESLSWSCRAQVGEASDALDCVFEMGSPRL